MIEWVDTELKDLKSFDIKKIYNSCRGCSGQKLTNFFNIKNLPMPEGHVQAEEEEYAQDLSVFVCTDCFLVQTQEDLDLDQYYKNYVYTPGISFYSDEFMKLTANKLIETGYISRNSKILEIGSGDGTQLMHFLNRGISVTGVEPSSHLVKLSRSRGVNTVEAMFDDALAQRFIRNQQKFDAILIQYTFDHLTDPGLFLKNAKDLLTPEGILLIEVHDFEKILSRNEACLFTHEHSIYPSKDSITNLIEYHGLKVIEYDFLPEKVSRGNSMTVIAAQEEARKPKSVLSLGDGIRRLRALETYNNFAQNISAAHLKLRKYLENARYEGKRVAGYGAAGRGVDTCVLADINSDLLISIYDKNTLFHRKLTPVSRIPVKDPKDLYDDCPDEVIVFSYGYIDEIHDFYSDFHGKIISMLDVMGG